MPSVRGNVQTLLTSAALTTSGVSPTANLSSLMGGEPDAGQFLLQAQTMSGTSPTLDVYLQWSIDAGTTWIDFLHFTQQTTTGYDAQLWSRRNANDFAGTPAGVVGNGVLAAGKSVNGPISSDYFRVKWILGGTITAVNFTLFACLDRD